MLNRVLLKAPFVPKMLIISGCLGLIPAAFAQDLAGQEEGPAYRLGLGTRIVLEDLTVTDAKGNPVTGLAQSAFHVSEDKRGQVILNFAESQLAEKATAVVPRMAAGTFGNYRSQQSQGMVAVLLIDPIGLELPDQMDLRLQMLKYLKQKPDDVPVVVYRSSSRGAPVLIQSLTTDRGLLLEAINHSVPTITRPVSTVYANAVAELQNMAEYLRTVPGKKALLWFAGSFPLYVQAEYGVAGALDEGPRGRQTRDAYRALEAARISVYPIDVRGVVNASIALNQASDVAAAANDPSTTTRAGGSDAQNIAGSYNDMDKLAAATGGRAFYSDNQIWKAMGSAITTAEHGYEIAYRPTEYVEDGRWHKITITVDGPYQVHYRAGYYAAEPNGIAEANQHERRRLPKVDEETGLAHAEEVPNATGAAALDRQIDFTAKVQPAADKGRLKSFEITYAVPVADLQFTTATNGTHHSKFRVVAIAYNTSGDLLGKTIEDVETNYSDTQMTLAARIGAPARQTIQVPKGAEFLMLAVQDLLTGRTGMVQLTTKTARAQAVSR